MMARLQQETKNSSVNTVPLASEASKKSVSMISNHSGLNCRIKPFTPVAKNMIVPQQSIHNQNSQIHKSEQVQNEYDRNGVETSMKKGSPKAHNRFMSDLVQREP